MKKLIFPLMLIILSFSVSAVLNIPNNNGLVGYWSFNECSSNKVGDYSGQGNIGTIFGNPAWSYGKNNCGLNFDGSGDYVKLIDPSVLNFGTNPFAVSMWVKTGSATYQVLYNRDSTTGTYLGIFTIVTSGVVRSYVGGVLRDGAISITDNRWHHLVVTRNSTGSVYLYVDTVLDSNFPYSQPGNTTITGRDASFGCYIPSQYPLNGLLDEIRFYNRYLSLDEVKSLYKSGSEKINKASNKGLIAYWSLNEGYGIKVDDASGYGNNATLVAYPGYTPPAWGKGRLGNGLTFNTYKSLNISNSTLFDVSDSGMSGSVWVYYTSNGYYNSLFSKMVNNATRYKGWYWGDANNGANNIVFVFGCNISNRIFAGDSTTMPLNKWIHLVFTYNGTPTPAGIKMYKNGVESSSYEYTTGTTFNNCSNYEGNLIFGQDAYDTPISWLPASADELRLYNRELSSSEVLALYKEGQEKLLASNNNGLIGYWSFNEGYGAQADDYSGNKNQGTLSGATWTSGIKGKGLSFDGTDDFITIPSSSSFAFGTGDFSTSLWYYANNFAVRYHVPYDGGYASSKGILLETDNVGQALRLYTNGAGISHFWTFPHVTNKWYHIVIIRTGNIMTAYVNGVALTITGSATNNGDIVASSYLIGKYSGGEFVNGKLDEMRFYNRALTATEVYNLYKGG